MTPPRKDDEARLARVRADVADNMADVDTVWLLSQLDRARAESTQRLQNWRNENHARECERDGFRAQVADLEYKLQRAEEALAKARTATAYDKMQCGYGQCSLKDAREVLAAADAEQTREWEQVKEGLDADRLGPRKLFVHEQAGEAEESAPPELKTVGTVKIHIRDVRPMEPPCGACEDGWEDSAEHICEDLRDPGSRPSGPASIEPWGQMMRQAYIEPQRGAHRGERPAQSENTEDKGAHAPERGAPDSVFSTIEDVLGTCAYCGEMVDMNHDYRCQRTKAPQPAEVLSVEQAKRAAQDAKHVDGRWADVLLHSLEALRAQVAELERQNNELRLLRGGSLLDQRDAALAALRARDKAVEELCAGLTEAADAFADMQLAWNVGDSRRIAAAVLAQRARALLSRYGKGASA